MIRKNSNPFRFLWAVCQTAGARRFLEKGWNLNWLSLVFVCCYHILFFAHWAFSQSTELPSNFLELLSQSGLNRRKWLFPKLCPCLLPSSWGSRPFTVFGSWLCTLWEVSSLFWSNVFIPQWTFSEDVLYVLDVRQADHEVSIGASAAHFQTVNFQT